MNTRARGAIPWGRAGLLTLAAAALVATLHLFSPRAELSPVDFVAGGAESLQFCDPLHPLFQAVEARQSPVSLLLRPAIRPIAGRTIEVTMSLRAASGRTIRSADLLRLCGKTVAVFAIDPSLSDFERFEPAEGARPGEWSFSLAPKAGGTYRLFADFEPAALGREVYASADLPVEGAGAVVPAAPSGPYRMALAASEKIIYARRPLELALRIERTDGAPLSAAARAIRSAQLVIFDERRSGIAILRAPDGAIRFKATFPDPGLYIAWAEGAWDSRELSALFPLRVLP
jgi:hypothetical protein